jgi:hypothetical protein
MENHQLLVSFVCNGGVTNFIIDRHCWLLCWWLVDYGMDRSPHNSRLAINRTTWEIRDK